jgi:AI-2 transport protein TqsA
VIAPVPEPQSLQRTLVAGACLVVLVAGVRAGAPVLVPLAVAIFIVLVSLPGLACLRHWGIPRPLAILLIVAGASALLAAVGWIVMRSADQVREALPAYTIRIHDLEASIIGTLHGWGIELSALPYRGLAAPERLLELATRAATGLTQLVVSAVLVLMFVVFMLSEAGGLPSKLARAMGDRAFHLERAAPIVVEVQRYLAIKTLISLVTGVLVATAASVLGVDFALFWGLLAFLLNFIPNLGSIVAALPAVALALLQLGFGSAIALAAAFLVINIVLGNFIDPMVMGRRLGLSTVVVLLSLLFWGWAWGPVGMILSLPLTMAAKIALENSTDYRWIAVLLGPAVAPDGTERSEVRASDRKRPSHAVYAPPRQDEDAGAFRR